MLKKMLYKLKKNFYCLLDYFEYKKRKRMKPCYYEDYISNFYNKMMNRFSFSKNEKMDFDNPLTFTQKQQWLNLYDCNNDKTIFTDKYEVRERISKLIGDQYLVPLISIDEKHVFENANEIDFKKLPNQFVIKCTHGSHMNIIVKDKAQYSSRDIRKCKNQLNKWLKTNYAFKAGIELHYKNIKPRIIIEKYIEVNDDLPDYKFFCFCGNPKFMWIDKGRFKNHFRTVYDLNFEPQPYKFDFFPSDIEQKKPECFDKMIKLSKIISKGFSMARVDFYEVNGKVYFGELTFTSHAGIMPPNPIEYNLKLGELISIDKDKRKNNYLFRKKGE